MRFSFVALVAVLAAETAYAVSHNVTYNTIQLTNVSQCSLKCLVPAIKEAGCGLTDYDCICASRKLYLSTAQCTVSKCGLYEAFGLVKASAKICEPPPQSRGPLIRRVDIGTQILARTAVVARLISRYWLQSRWMPDDWVIALVFVLDIPCIIFRVRLVDHGLGKRIWMIDFDDLKVLLKLMWTSELFYITLNGLVKTSILLSYLNIFPDKSFRKQCWCMIAFCNLTMAVFLMTTLFECVPMPFAWDKSIEGGMCVNFNAVVWAHAAMNIVQEIIILGLPIRQLWKLQMSWQKKVSIVMLFTVGGFVCITAVVRTYSLRQFGLTADPTWDNVDGVNWSVLEVSIATACSSLPALRGPFLRLTKRFWPSFGGPSSKNQNGKPSQRHPGPSPHASSKRDSDADAILRVETAGSTIIATETQVSHYSPEKYKARESDLIEEAETAEQGQHQDQDQDLERGQSPAEERASKGPSLREKLLSPFPFEEKYSHRSSSSSSASVTVPPEQSRKSWWTFMSFLGSK